MSTAVPLLLIALVPSAVAVGVLGALRATRALQDAARRRAREAAPAGPPLERTAADLRRLLAQRAALRASPTLPGRTARSAALAGALTDCACDAARALGLPEPERHGRQPLSPPVLHALLDDLAASGLVLASREDPTR